MKVTNAIIMFLALIGATSFAQETNEIDYITADIPVYLKAGMIASVTIPKCACALPSKDFANTDKLFFAAISTSSSHMSELANKTEVISAEIHMSELANKTEVISAEISRYNQLNVAFTSYLSVLGSTVMCTDECIPTILGNTSTISSTLPVKYQIAAALSTTSDITYNYKFMYQDLDMLVPMAEEDSYFGVKGREIFYCMQTRDYAQAQRLIDEYQAVWTAVHSMTNTIKRHTIK